jgi:hypothetical protein
MTMVYKNTLKRAGKILVLSVQFRTITLAIIVHCIILDGNIHSDWRILLSPTPSLIHHIFAQFSASRLFEPWVVVSGFFYDTIFYFKVTNFTKSKTLAMDAFCSGARYQGTPNFQRLKKEEWAEELLVLKVF